MSKQTVGGVQYVPQIAVQYVYLDFDGELTDYNGEILTIEGVEVRDSKLTQTRIADILAELNKKYASQNVIFVTERPVAVEYSTIFIGETEAFDQYGSFAGLAETVDFNNQNRSDNAFVNLDSTATNEQIISTISHEIDHLLGTLSHGGDSLANYAEEIPYNSVYTGILDSSLVLSHYQKNYDSDYYYKYDRAINIILAPNISGWHRGNLTIMSGGVASNILMSSGTSLTLSGGGTAHSVTQLSGACLTINSGGTATDLHIESGAKVVLTVDSNTYAYGTYADSFFKLAVAYISGYSIESAGSMFIEFGAIADHTIIQSAGVMNINHGGAAPDTTVSSGGCIHIKSGGFANRTNIEAGGTVMVSSWGVAQSSIVRGSYSIYGSLNISSGGEAIFTNIDSRGVMNIKYGGIARSSIINSKGSMVISARGEAGDTTMFGGSMIISSGGTANRTNASSVGDVKVLNGGSANFTTVQNYGALYVSNGGFANYTTIGSNGILYIKGGGSAANISVSSGGRLSYITDSNSYAKGTFDGSAFEMSGSYLSGNTFNFRCDLQISSGGSANQLTFNSGATIYVYSGGEIRNTTLNNNGIISMSGVADNIVVNSGGEVYVASGIAKNIHVNSGGIIQAGYNCSVSNIYLNSGASMRLYSGGCISGELRIDSGATVMADSGTVIKLSMGERNENDGYLIDGISMLPENLTCNLTVSGSMESGMYKLAQGAAAFSGIIKLQADNTILDTLQMDGTLIMYNSRAYYLHSDGGNIFLAVDDDFENAPVKLYSNGVLRRYGTTFANETINLSMHISSGGIASSVTNDWGSMIISSGGIATSVTNNRGSMTIYSGGIATSVTNDWGSMIISSGGIATSTTNRGSMTISSGGVANHISGGTINIYSGGTATNIQMSQNTTVNLTIASNTYVQWISGGTAFEMKDCKISNHTVSGYMNICSGGTATDNIVDGGNMYIFSGGMVANTTLKQRGGMSIHGGVANNTTLDSYWCKMAIFSGGMASDTMLYGSGSMYIHSGGTAENTNVKNTGRVYVSSGGSVRNTSVYSGGLMYISQGGTAVNTTVEHSGKLYVSSGGSGVGIKENGGYVEVADGTDVSFVSNTISGMLLPVRVSMSIHSNTIASDTTIGVWGAMCLCSGGVANKTAVVSGGSMYLSSGGTHRGVLNITSGAVVSAYTGAVIDFTLTDRSAADGYLINDLSLISGAPTYTITVSADQAEGTYKLAQGAGSFTGSITIGTDTLDYGTLAVNGSAVENDTLSYRLVKTDGNLNLVVEDKTAALPDLRMAEYDVSSNSITTQESVKLTFKVYNDGNADAPASTIKVYDGDKLLREVALGEIAAGSYRNCYITLTAGKLSVGTHKVNVVLDSGNAIAESREDNNNSYRTIFVKAPAAKPDLRMAEYDVSSNSITTQESVKLTFKVYNDGNADAPASTIKVYDGDRLLREVALGEIAAGAYRNCYITIPAGKLSVGTHKVNVVLDAGNDIAESNENNNNSYRTIFVKAATAQPDLRMAEYNVSSNNITTEESVKLTFKVYNDGDVKAHASIIKVYDGDRLLREVTLGEIDAKGYRNCTITLVVGKLSVGTHKVNVVLDSGNLIAESNENNNTSYRTIFVKEPVRSSVLADKADNAWDVSGTGSVDALCGGNYADLGEWSLENSVALTRSAADILTTDKEESRLLNSGKLAG